MQKKRKRFQTAFKAKVALATAKGDRSTSELTSLSGVHATQIASWKKQLLDGAAALFADGHHAGNLLLA